MALTITLRSMAEKCKLQNYSKVQERYIKWALNRDIDPYTPNPTQLVNWLASSITTQHWKASTANTYFKTIIQLYDDPTIFNTDMDCWKFLNIVKNDQIQVLHELDVNLSLIHDFFLTQDVTLLGFQDLMIHLCWMLTVIGILCPDSIHCIDLSHPSFKINNKFIILLIHRPKEK